MRTIILRFRDIVTRPDGTIQRHNALIRQFGEVWWGWWSRDQELTPRDLLRELADRIDSEGYVTIYLYHSTSYKFYRANVIEIMVAPRGQRMTTPVPEKSPAYYHETECSAWFLFTSIEEVSFAGVEFRYDSFPTRLDAGTISQLVGLTVSSLDQLKAIEVTMIPVQVVSG